MHNENAGESDLKLQQSLTNRCSFCDANVSCQELKQDLKLVTQQIKSFQFFNKERWRRALGDNFEELSQTKGFSNCEDACISLSKDLENLMQEADRLLSQIRKTQLTCPVLAK